MRLRFAQIAFAAAICLVLAAIASAAGPVAIRSGHDAGVAWTLSVTDSFDGATFQYCTSLAFKGADKTLPHGTESCGGFFPGPRAGAPPSFPYGVSMGFVRHCPGGFSLGYRGTVASARRVTITMSDDKVVRTTTIPAPKGQSHAMRFFVTALPCTAAVDRVTARDGAGRLVGREYTTPLPAHG